MVLVTMRVLPFLFLTVVLTCSVTLLVSTLGVRSYSDQRYSSMQMSTTRHSSSGSTAPATGRAPPPTRSGPEQGHARRRFFGRLGGGHAREAEGGFARVWIGRRCIGGRCDCGCVGRLAELAMGRR